MLVERLQNLQTTQTTRGYIGASVMGNDCDRYIWLNKRDDLEYTLDFKTLSIFRRGTDEEIFLTESVKRLPDVEFIETQTKLQVPYLKGHTDSLLKIDGELYILEIKTMKQDIFNAHKKKGVKINNFGYWLQCQIYLYISIKVLNQDVKGAILLASNKNTQELHQEIIQFDEKQTALFMGMAQRIFELDSMPEGLYSGGASPEPKSKCEYCFFKDFCYGD